MILGLYHPFKWSWRESNPRPNEELMSFLHAYLRWGCRDMASAKLPTITLVPKVSPLARDRPPTISDIICTTCSNRFGTTAFGWCLVPAPCGGIKLIYCTSIKQRERKCFRQLTFRGPRLKSRATALCMLTHHLHPLSKPVSPMWLCECGIAIPSLIYWECEGTTLLLNCQYYWHFFLFFMSHDTRPHDEQIGQDLYFFWNIAYIRFLCALTIAVILLTLHFKRFD